MHLCGPLDQVVLVTVESKAAVSIREASRPGTLDLPQMCLSHRLRANPSAAAALTFLSKLAVCSDRSSGPSTSMFSWSLPHLPQCGPEASLTPFLLDFCVPVPESVHELH